MLQTSVARLPRGGALRAARGLIGAGAVVAVASMAVNGLAAVVPLLAADLLPAADLGVLAALLGLSAVGGVIGIGLQTALAVRFARQASVPGADRVSVLTAGVATGALLVAVPVISLILRVPWYQPLLIAALTAPVVLAGRWLGELQGRQSYGRLALGMLLLGLGRYGGVLAALGTGLGITAALAVGAGGALASVTVVALWLTGPFRAAPAPVRTGQVEAAPAAASGPAANLRVGARDVLRAGSATIAMLTVSYADLVLARALLSPDDAGTYAVGSVLTKGALWAPAALTVLALPMFAQARRNAVRLTLAGTAACGVVLIAASLLFQDFAVALVGRGNYPHLAPAAAGFATVGALYALVFVLVNAEIAAAARRPAIFLWVGLAGIVTAAATLRPSTVGALLVLAAVTAGGTLTATALAYSLRRRRPTADAEPSPT
jgi:O-antigen/teichoic acid export membrane protein